MFVSHHNSFADKHHFSLLDEVKRVTAVQLLGTKKD
jgi:hypothetical protein